MANSYSNKNIVNVSNINYSKISHELNKSEKSQ